MSDTRYLKVTNRRQLALLRHAFTRCLFLEIPQEPEKEQRTKINAFMKKIEMDRDADLFYDFDRQLSQAEMDALWQLVLALQPVHLLDSSLFTLETKFRLSPGGSKPIVFDDIELSFLLHYSIREDETFTEEDGGMELRQFIDSLCLDFEKLEDDGMISHELPEGMSEGDMDAIFGIRNAPDSPVIVEWKDREKAHLAVPPPPKGRHDKN